MNYNKVDYSSSVALRPAVVYRYSTCCDLCSIITLVFNFYFHVHLTCGITVHYSITANLEVAHIRVTAVLSSVCLVRTTADRSIEVTVFLCYRLIWMSVLLCYRVIGSPQ